MRRELTVVAVLLFSVAIAGWQNPARADLSGTWRMDEARSGSPGHQSFRRPVTRVIRQTPTTLEIEHTAGDSTSAFKYSLTEVRPDRALGVTRTNLAYWDGPRLITETVQSISGQTVTMKETWSLAPDGGELTVQRVVEVEHGYTFREGQNYSTVTDVFVRATP